MTTTNNPFNLSESTPEGTKITTARTEDRLREEFHKEFGLDDIPIEKIPMTWSNSVINWWLSKLSLAKQEVFEEKGLHRYWEPCAGCKDGHPSIWKTLVESPQWKAWYEHASKNMLYDVDESQELGAMSTKHFQDFMGFNSQEAEKKVLEDLLTKTEDICVIDQPDIHADGMRYAIKRTIENIKDYAALKGVIL